MNKILPIKYDVGAAIAVIDKVYKDQKVYKYSTPSRVTSHVCIPLACSPCIAWSTIARVLSCPFNCLFNKHTACNPISSLLTDSALTQTSDTCISSVYDHIDEKHSIRHIVPDESANEIIIYAAKKIRETPSTKVQYLICDVISPLLLYNYSIARPTPSGIVELADKLNGIEPSTAI